MRGLLLRVRRSSCALTLDAVQEVLELRTTGPPVPLPGAPAAVLGILNVRGRMVCVLDTAALLDLAPLDPAERVAVAVVRLARGRAALACSELPRIAVLEGERGPSALATAQGRHRAGGEVTTLLDLEATASPERVAR